MEEDTYLSIFEGFFDPSITTLLKQETEYNEIQERILPKQDNCKLLLQQYQ